MKRHLFLTACLLLWLLCLPMEAQAAQEPASPAVSSRNRIIAAVPADMPPTFYRDAETGRAAGFAIDVMNNVARQAGLEVEYVFGKPWDELHRMVLEGRADLIPNLVISQTREKMFIFTDAVETLTIGLVRRASDRVHDGLAPGTKVGAIRGSMAEDYLKNHGEATVELYDSMQHLLMDLLGGDVDLALAPIPNFMKLAIDAEIEDRLRVIEPPVMEAKRAMALRPGDEALRDRLNAAISSFVSTPEYQAIYVKWWGKPRPFWTVRRVAAAMGLLLFTTVAGFMLLRYRDTLRLNRKLHEAVTDLEASKAALRDSEDFFRAIYENQQTAIVMIDPATHTIADANSAALRLIGATKDEVIGKVCHKFLCPVEMGRCPITDLGQTVDASERLLININSIRVPVLKTVKHATISGREYLIESFIDITERKNAEKALREAREKAEWLARFPEENPNPVARVSDQGRLLYLNPAGAQLPGWAAEVGQPIPAPLLLMVGQAMAEGQELQQDRELGGKHYSVSITPFPREGYANIYGRDITERKQAEAALRESEERLRAIFDSVEDFIFIKNSDRRYILVNTFFKKRFDIDPSVFIGKTDAEISIFEDRENAAAIIEDTDGRVLQGETVNYEIRHRIRETSVILDVIKTPIRDDQGRVTSICGLSRDVTERHQAAQERIVLEERLQRAEKMEALGTLAGGVAHDLNNVLGILVGYSELLLVEIEESSAIRTHVEYIMQGGQRAAAIVQDLLTLARRGVQARKTVNLNTAITDYQKRPEFEALRSFHSNVQIKTRLQEDLLSITGSPVHLEKTIMNLVSNAVEAMPRGGTLILSTSNEYLDRPIPGYDEVREGDYVVLSVSDTGEGISPMDMKRIFEPFYTKKVMGRSGTGLGLAVVWGTVKDHNGYINVQSVQGKGTTFSLYFPVTRGDVPEEQPSIPLSKYMGKRESILVVDDVKGQRELAGRMLSRLNYSVAMAASGEEAVEYARRGPVDLIVLDMIMEPGIDGLETYRRIKEIRPEQRAIIVSGFSETDRVSQAQALGAGSYVRKPYVLESLGMAVREELDKPG